MVVNVPCFRVRPSVFIFSMFSALGACMLSRFSCVQLFATPWTAACQAPCSWGFCRQEYWSGLPCPPPGHLPNPGIKPRSPALQAVSLLSEPPGKSKNTGVGSLSLLQGIFPTQESNWGLLHCRQILYQLSYQGSPFSAPPPLLLLLLLLSRVSCVRLCATP